MSGQMIFVDFDTGCWEPVTIGTFLTVQNLCPDLLRYEQIGAADNMRGRVVRAFFWLMRAWKVGC